MMNRRKEEKRNQGSRSTNGEKYGIGNRLPNNIYHFRPTLYFPYRASPSPFHLGRMSHPENGTIIQTTAEPQIGVVRKKAPPHPEITRQQAHGLFVHHNYCWRHCACKKFTHLLRRGVSSWLAEAPSRPVGEKKTNHRLRFVAEDDYILWFVVSLR